MTIVSGHVIIFWLFSTYVLYFLHNIHFSVLFSSCWEKFWFIQWKLINLGKKTCYPQGKNRKQEYLGSACLIEIILCVVNYIEVKGNRIWTSVWSLSEDKGSWIFLHTSSCMDIEMLLVFWCQSGCQGMSQTHYNVFVRLVPTTCFMQDFSKCLEKERVKKSLPWHAELLAWWAPHAWSGVRDLPLLCSLQPHKPPCVVLPLAGWVLLWGWLFFACSCLLVVWGGNEAGREVLGRGVWLQPVGCTVPEGLGSAAELQCFGVWIHLLGLEMAVALTRLWFWVLK